MMHQFRRFGVTYVESTEDLARILSDQTQSLCSGFQHRGLLFLNDSISENDSQEYAIICNGQQVESITFGWCTKEKSEGYIRNLLVGNFDETGPIRPITEPAEGHTCLLCQ